MIFRIHFNDDSFIIEGDTIEEIQEKANKELLKRRIDINKHDVWSEEVK